MADDRSKIEKLVGMLGSDHEGEQLNALRFLKKIAAEQKKTLVEILMTGTDRIVYLDRIVYRDPPVQQPYRRNYSGKGGSYQHNHSSRFEERHGGTRELLDELAKAGEEGGDTLSWRDLEFARTAPYEYDCDEDLSPGQVRYAKSVIKRFRRSNAEPVV